MVTVSTTTQTVDGVTLVRARLGGAAVPIEVRIDNACDGPVWPPRSHGRPLAGWDEDGYQGVVPAEETVVMGYATPAPAADPPVTVVDRTARPEWTAGDEPSEPGSVLRQLGDPRPPADAVPTPASSAPTRDAAARSTTGGGQCQHAESGAGEGGGSATGSSAGASPEGGDGTAPEPGPRSPENADPTDPPDEPPASAGSSPVSAPPHSNGGDGDEATDHPVIHDHDDAVPPAVLSWFADVEARLGTAEALAGARTLPEATAAVERAGGLEGARGVDAALAADARALAAIAERAQTLASEAEAVDVPIETMERLA